jgi:hypothetical protein
MAREMRDRRSVIALRLTFLRVSRLFYKKDEEYLRVCY